MLLSDLELKAYAKINLGIDVTGRRDDGYHLVRMVMQSVDIYDTVILKKRDDDGIGFTCTDERLQTDDNLCVKAARLFCETTGRRCGTDIRLIKNNPVAAGMAGGSTDAAAVLKGMAELYDIDISEKELCDIAVSVGADVPFCIHGGTALCEGIGEVLTPIYGMPECVILVAKPDVQVSTAGIYKKLDGIGEYGHPDIDGIRTGIESHDIHALCSRMGNVLELVTGSEVPEIAVLEDAMMEQGACKAMMTGSGPTVFGIFLDIDDAEKCMHRIKTRGLCSFIKITSMKDRY